MLSALSVTLKLQNINSLINVLRPELCIKILFSSALTLHPPWPPILISVLFRPGFLQALGCSFFTLRVFMDFILYITYTQFLAGFFHNALQGNDQ